MCIRDRCCTAPGEDDCSAGDTICDGSTCIACGAPGAPCCTAASHDESSSASTVCEGATCAGMLSSASFCSTYPLAPTRGTTATCFCQLIAAALLNTTTSVCSVWWSWRAVLHSSRHGRLQRRRDNVQRNYLHRCAPRCTLILQSILLA